MALNEKHHWGRACPYPDSLSFSCGLFFCLTLAGCSPRLTPAQSAPAPVPSGELLAPGVIHRAIATPDGGVDIIDIDLDTARARWTIQTSGITMEEGRVVGQARTPRDWLTRLNGLASVNGGYFGGEDAQGRKEFVGLLVQKGRVRHAAPPLHGQGSATVRRGQYVRSTFGLTKDGKPIIVWAATEPGHPQSLRVYDAPMSRHGQPWRIVSAVGCGPRLITEGRVAVSDYEERLVSPGPAPRTFVAYDAPNGRPRHLLLGMASGATFQDLAAFLKNYFPQYDQTQAAEAMCVDGGASTQMAYRLNGTLQSPRETGVTVPDALVLLPPR